LSHCLRQCRKAGSTLRVICEESHARVRVDSAKLSAHATGAAPRHCVALLTDVQIIVALCGLPGTTAAVAAAVSRIKVSRMLGRARMALRACIPHLRHQEIIAAVPPPRPPRVEPALGCPGACGRGYAGPTSTRARDAGYSLTRPLDRVACRPGDVFGARRVRAGGGVWALSRIE
jgi:hypothetical protein